MKRAFPLLRATLIASVATAALLPAASALAVPTSREAALAAYQQTVADSQVAAGWTGDVATCTVGTESQASIDATLRTVNTLRDFAGLAPVVFEATRNQKALAAALMMRAKGDLSHEPDPAWPCYSADGASGAGQSNLFLGVSGPDAMVGYVDDAGVASLGHRYWVLDPHATTFGTGSTGSTNALAVVDSAPTPVRQNDLVAWPPRSTFVPSEWVFGDWSLEIPSVAPWGPMPDFAAATVAVNVNGVAAPVSGTTSVGSGRLKWKVALPAGTSAADAKVDVTVTGATLAALPYPVAYSTTILAATPQTPPAAAGTGGGADSRMPDPAASKPKVQSTGSITATIRSGRASRGAKVSVGLKGVADGSKVKLTWAAQGKSVKRCRSAAKKATKTVTVAGGKARTKAPRCKGNFRLRANLGSTELIRRSITVR